MSLARHVTPASAALAVLLGGLLLSPRPSDSAGTTALRLPASIDARCGTDVTAQLDAYFARVPRDATVLLPSRACYLVSDTSSFTIADTRHLTIAGSWSTFEQATYPLGSNHVVPVVTLRDNSQLRIQDVTVKGPGSGGGDTSEGDYGVLAVGNRDVTLDEDTIEDVDGDGLALYPDLARNTEINTDVSFVNGRLSDVGYHGVTLEGVDGFTFRHDHVDHYGNFMDLEVDAPCGPRCSGPSGAPVGAGEWDVDVDGNTFTASRGGLWVESAQACVPARDWSFSDNRIEGPIGGFFLGACGASDPSVGLTFADDTSTGVTGGAWGGSVVDRPSSAMITIRDYKDVTFEGNTAKGWPGERGYYPNTIATPFLGLCDVTGARIEHNTLDDVYAPWYEGFAAHLPCAAGSTDSDVVSCGDTYGLTTPIEGAAPDPKSDGPCTARG